MRSTSGGSRVSFAHLHTHTEFSMLDGASRVPELIAAAKADGQPAIGITDHGNMYGVLDFYAAAREADLVPVVGLEAYFVTTDRRDRPRRADHEIFHLTLLAENNAGYQNLIKVASAAYLDGFFYKPRADFELLERHRDGLIATSGCLGGAICQSLLRGDERGARELAARFQDVLGRDSFFIELQEHGLADQRRVNPTLVQIAN
ncbi:MAG: PHP domain-containing protein, partial [Acidimicrobiia bacterium]